MEPLLWRRGNSQSHRFTHRPRLLRPSPWQCFSRAIFGERSLLDKYTVSHLKYIVKYLSYLACAIRRILPYVSYIWCKHSTVNELCFSLYQIDNILLLCYARATLGGLFGTLPTLVGMFNEDTPSTSGGPWADPNAQFSSTHRWGGTA